MSRLNELMVVHAGKRTKKNLVWYSLYSRAVARAVARIFVQFAGMVFW